MILFALKFEGWIYNSKFYFLSLLAQIKASKSKIKFLFFCGKIDKFFFCTHFLPKSTNHNQQFCLRYQIDKKNLLNAQIFKYSHVHFVRPKLYGVLYGKINDAKFHEN